MILKSKVDELKLTLDVDFQNFLDVNYTESPGKFSPIVYTDDVRVK